MKRYVWCILIIGAFLALAAPPGTLAQDKPNYFAVKAGGYFPTGDLEDADFDTGFNGELAYGFYVNPTFALEGGIGYFESEADASGFDPFLGFFSEDDDISAVPITVTALGFLPAGQAKFYGGAGVGLYFVNFEGNLSTSAFGNFSVDDDDTVLGGHLVAGLNFDISPAVYIGVEGKYIFTGEAEATGSFLGVPFVIESDLNGFMLTGNLGFRF